MQLQRILLILTLLTTIVGGFDLNPLTIILPGVAPFLLPGVCLVAFLGVHLTHTHALTQAWTQAETDREAWHEVTTQLAVMQQTVTHLTEAAQTTQQTLSEYETLLPGRLLLLQRRYEEAVKTLQQNVEQLPTSLDARWLLGEALFGLKRYTEALPHLHAGLVVENEHRLALMAQCEQALGHYEDAEQRIMRLIDIRGEARQEDLVTLGSIQSASDPQRAADTLEQALALNPLNSAARYQLIELKMRTGAYEEAIELATEGLERNPTDIGCFVSRAEAYFRRGWTEDEKAILHDLMLAQAKNRKDYNIYRLRGALYQRQASRADNATDIRQALQHALEAYEEGLRNAPGKFQAHLLAAESRILLQLRRFSEAVKTAQRAVEHHPGHVSNHLALALAQLAARQWRAVTRTTGKGMQWAGWGGRIWLTAISIFAHACAGVDPETLRAQCTALATELDGDKRDFTLSETWETVRDVLRESTIGIGDANGTLVRDTIALLESTMSPREYRHTWGTR
jgi:tetratricopeptide (TPR) repeat protein